MEIFLVGFVALVFKMTEFTCEKKRVPEKRAFVFGFLAVLVAFIFVIILGLTIRPDAQPITQTRFLVWSLVAIILSLLAGFKCSMTVSTHTE
tara:strand:+ start:740 stop:1015 length:276 start_codon:yes stop_codon:yes gene_type:complete